MNILILGNGFDLAHGLKTKYNDFLEYCETQQSIEPIDESLNPFHLNIWISHFLCVKQNIGNTWIDLEEEIYKVILRLSTYSIMMQHSWNCQKMFYFYYGNRALTTVYNFVEKLDNFAGISATERGYTIVYSENALQFMLYIENPKGLINFLYDQLREFTKEFEKYLQEKVLKELKSTTKYRLSFTPEGSPSFSNTVHVLNFNYTDTCEKLYEHQDGYLHINSFDVHGQVGANNCNLVLGTHSFNNEQIGGQKLPPDFNIFQKHYQRHKYGTIEQYQNLLKRIKLSETAPVFYIVGHSLDRTDHNVLRHIFKANSNSTINIYYHDEEAQERLMNNINAIIGEEEVMAKVRFIDQHDIRRGILR